MITLTWSWFAFFAGIAATMSVGFWGVLFIAFLQYKKSKKKELDMDMLFKRDRV
jgi:hypothetical protein